VIAHVCVCKVSDLGIALQKTCDCTLACCLNELDMFATAQEQCPKGLAAKHWQLCALQLVPELYHQPQYTDTQLCMEQGNP
jgi:hypothetical protein